MTRIIFRKHGDGRGLWTLGRRQITGLWIPPVTSCVILGFPNGRGKTNVNRPYASCVFCGAF